MIASVSAGSTSTDTDFRTAVAVGPSPNCLLIPRADKIDAAADGLLMAQCLCRFNATGYARRIQGCKYAHDECRAYGKDDILEAEIGGNLTDVVDLGVKKLDMQDPFYTRNDGFKI